MYSKIYGRFKLKGYGNGVAITEIIMATNYDVADMADIVAAEIKINSTERKFIEVIKSKIFVWLE